MRHSISSKLNTSWIIIKIAYFKKTLDPMHTTLYIVYHPIYCMPPYILYTALYIVCHPIHRPRHGVFLCQAAGGLPHCCCTHDHDLIPPYILYTTLYIVYHPTYCIPPYILYVTLYIGFDTDASFLIKPQGDSLTDVAHMIMTLYHPIYCIPLCFVLLILYTILHIVCHPIYCMPPYI